MASSSGSCEIHFAFQSKGAKLETTIFRGLKTVKIAHKKWLITGTALLHPHEFILPTLSLLPILLYFICRDLLWLLSLHFFPHCSFPLPPHTSSYTVYSTPLRHPSLFPNIHFCLSLFPSSFLLISHPQSVLLSPSLSLSFCPAPYLSLLLSLR